MHRLFRQGGEHVADVTDVQGEVRVVDEDGHASIVPNGLSPHQWRRRSHSTGLSNSQ